MTPVLKIYRGYRMGSYTGRLNVGALELIGSNEIVFNKKNFNLRVPTIYDNKTSKISSTNNSGGVFHIGRIDGDESEVCGYYLLEQEGDIFFLTKQTEKPCPDNRRMPRPYEKRIRTPKNMFTISYNKTTTFNARMSTTSFELIGSDKIVFDIDELTIRKALEGDKFFYKLKADKTSGFYFYFNYNAVPEDIIGRYLVEKNENTGEFRLVKFENSNQDVGDLERVAAMQ